MELSPRLYHLLIRPKLFLNKYVSNLVNLNFDFDDKTVLDFGCGVGSSCFMFDSTYYLGLDCCSERIEYARLLHPDYSFGVIRGDEMPLKDNSIDYILIISVLHHIPSETLRNYMAEFHRVLKRDGKIIVIEPCFFNNSYLNNFFMSFLDKGKYIRSEKEYFDIFNSHYETNLLKKYKQLFLYNKIFFTASPK